MADEKSERKSDAYSNEEAAQRFKDALRGARLAGHVPMKAKKAAKKKRAKKKNVR
jgi:hypothetical protein